MTKTIVIGNEPKEVKRVEFITAINQDGTKVEAGFDPVDFDFIELIAKGYGKYDIMWAYNDSNNRNNGVLYLGYWNDGIV